MDALKILLVDDDRSLAITLSQGLRKALGTAVSVVLCASGAEALALLSSQAFHVVISDFHMPGMSGLELLKQIGPGHSEMSLVLITAFATEALAQEARQLGIGFIPKPFELPALVQLIRRHAPGEAEVGSTPPTLIPDGKGAGSGTNTLG